MDPANGQNKISITALADVRALGWQDAGHLAIGYSDGRIQRVDIGQGKDVAVDQLGAPIVDLAAHRSVPWLAVRTGENKVALFHDNQRKEVAALADINDAGAIAWLGDASLALGRDTGKVTLINVESGQVTRELDFGQSATQLLFHPPSNRIVVGGRDGLCKVFQAADGAAVHSPGTPTDVRLQLEILDRHAKREQASVDRLNGAQ